MKREFKTWVILLAFSIPIAPMLFLIMIYFSNCGISNNCARGNLAEVIHTSIPTLLPATLTAPTPGGTSLISQNAACTAPAATLLAAWVGGGSSQSQPFIYSDTKGEACAATFADIQPLFTSANLWYPGALACSTCHNSSLAASSAGLDLSSFAGLQAGSQRTPGSASGSDLLGGGNWSAALLNQVLFVKKQMPVGAPSGLLSDQRPLIHAGTISTIGITPTPAVAQLPRPSNPGGPGQAVSLTGDTASGATVFAANCVPCHGEAGKGGVTNPGSDRGVVPTLNPIDPLLKGTDAKAFAMNIDLFIQHGSTPKGANPFRTMPAWGDQNALTQQQIADVIAYLISLNK